MVTNQIKLSTLGTCGRDGAVTHTPNLDVSGGDCGGYQGGEKARGVEIRCT